ncbi:MAG: hypothetical protein QOJ73_2540 [Streptosporangiaceae bacterium]|nr:hypothetical protein [Streptosporangiaceae bacterium]
MNSEPPVIAELRSALDEEAGDLRVPPGAAQRARSRARRRRTARGLLAGVPAVALATGLVLAMQNNPGGPATSATGTTANPTAPAASAASQPAVETAAYVAKHVEAVLANANHYIIRETTNSYAGGTYTSWTDPRTGSAYAVQGTGSGKVLSWNSAYFVKRVLHWSTTQANYSTHTWFVSVIHAAGPVQGPLPKPADGGDVSPAQLRHWLKDGTMRVVGHGHVNGRQATALRAQLAIGTLKIWVDSQTFEPVREISSLGVGQRHTLVFNESWVPRTARLVSLANHPQVPAGFTQVPVGQP